MARSQLTIPLSAEQALTIRNVVEEEILRRLKDMGLEAIEFSEAPTVDRCVEMNVRVRIPIWKMEVAAAHGPDNGTTHRRTGSR